MTGIIKFKKKIDNIENLDENLDVIFDCSISKLSEEASCELVSSNNIENDLTLIPIYQIVDIIDNLKQQIISPTYAEIINAIIFYKENDAFIQIVE